MRPPLAPPYLFITAHDIRSRRKTSLHFIAAELALRGPTRVFSLAFSPLSRLRGRDPRLGLERRANRVERVDGVEGYLWMTPVHPGALSGRLRAIAPPAFALYRRCSPPILREWIAAAGTVIVEAGTGILFIAEVARLNPGAQIVYMASDDLETVAVDPYVRRALIDAAHLLAYAALPSPRLARGLPHALDKAFIPHGIASAALGRPTISPFSPGSRNMVSVGSMLFDAAAIKAAAVAHPDLTLHVIGAGRAIGEMPRNVVQYPEMPFAQTLAYLQHADVGLAAYRRAPGAEYLADTSMKLMQYGWLGLPAVCPDFATGGRPLRFGYDPAELSSIGLAVGRALAATPAPVPALSWAEVADRLLDPQAFCDTRLPSSDWSAAECRGLMQAVG